MREIRLRHHHLLCTQTFSGKGYDYRFVANMEDVVSALRSPEDLLVHISIAVDDVCSSCPNEVRGMCKDELSVVEKDRAAAMFLSLPEVTSLPAEPLLRSVRERLLGLDDFQLVCGECEWMKLCNRWLVELRSRER
ncbi:MAG: DUF1284 domain-containing protein [Methanomassiliicoccales archaeon]|nr:DUF1284 domain-containing protein [Methanomassiliicoccales archaeon]